MIPNRIKRLSHLMARNISDVIRYDMKDPNLGFISVTDVTVASDMATAKVFISVLVDDMSAREETVSRLNRAAGFIRARLNEKMTIKRTPLLIFVLDTSIERGVRVSSLIDRVRAADREIMKEDEEPGPETAGD
jgi:ribosome-binding factor A